MSSQRTHACSAPGCDKSFVRREHLYRHRLNHKPKRLHNCTCCGKTFVRLDLLKRHKKRHDNGMPAHASRKSSSWNVALNSITPETQDASTLDLILSSQSEQEYHGSAEELIETPRLGTVHTGQTESSALSSSMDLFLGYHSLEEPQMLFDSPKDAQDLNEEIDRLFQSLPSDEGTYDIYNTGQPVISLPYFSPSETNSIQSLTSTTSASHAMWSDVRDKIIVALEPLLPSLRESSFFDPSNLERFYLIYFENYNTHFPILHKASFSCLDANPLLLLAILTLGATLSEQEHYEASKAIHDKLRWLVFSSAGFQPPAPLWCLQALLIIQAHEKMFSTRKHHELSHIFHSAIITLMRRGSSYSEEFNESLGAAPSLERAWHIWVEKESTKRTAFFAFIMDAQHTSIFGHNAALSISDIYLPLPCAEALWDAKAASRWKVEKDRSEEPPSFLSALRGLLARRTLPSTWSAFSRFILLHGIFNITKHMQERAKTATEVNEVSLPSDNTPEEGAWQEALDRAIETWSLSLLSQQPSLCLEAARPLQRIAHVTIYIDLKDFHTLARAPSLIGNRTSPQEYSRARSRILTWTEQSAAKRSLLHCLLLVQETMFTRKKYQAAEDNIVLRPWCLYHATLILWAYGLLKGGGYPASFLPAEEYLAQMLNGLMEPEGEISIANRTHGLIDTVKDSLVNCRWELLQEAHTTLGNLITAQSTPTEDTPF